MSVRSRKLKDGSVVYQARRFMGYREDGTPDQRSRTFPTKRQAELEDARMLAEREAMRGRSGRMTLSQYIDNRYWPTASKRLAATSRDTYEKEIRLRIRPALGNVDMRDIDRRRIQAMLDRAGTESVARKCLGVLKTVLNEAKGDGLLLSNPAEAKYAMPPKGGTRGSGLVLTTFADIDAMLDEIEARGSLCVQKIAFLGFLQGLRPEERYALDCADVDLANSTVSVRAAYVSASQKHGGRQMKDPKTLKSARVLPMHPRFEAWARTLPRSEGPFIKGQDLKRISPSTAQKRWSRFLAANPDLPKVTIENMRHSFATSYLHAGGNVEDLSKLLGHSDINTTFRRYVRPNVDDLRRGMLAVSSADKVQIDA